MSDEADRMYHEARRAGAAKALRDFQASQANKPDRIAGIELTPDEAAELQASLARTRDMVALINEMFPEDAPIQTPAQPMQYYESDGGVA